MKVLRMFILGILCTLSTSMADAMTPKEVVQAFGSSLSNWCESGKLSCCKKIEELCNGSYRCLVDSKILEEYQAPLSINDLETVQLDTYLLMLHHKILEGLKYKILEIEVCGEEKSPEGVSITLLKASIDISGPINQKKEELFLVRDGKISGIYSCDSQLGVSKIQNLKK